MEKIAGNLKHVSCLFATVFVAFVVKGTPGLETNSIQSSGTKNLPTHAACYPKP